MGGIKCVVFRNADWGQALLAGSLCKAIKDGCSHEGLMFPVHRKACGRCLILTGTSSPKSMSRVCETLISTRKGISLPSTHTDPYIHSLGEERMDVKVSGATGLSFVGIGVSCPGDISTWVALIPLCP